MLMYVFLQRKISSPTTLRHLVDKVSLEALRGCHLHLKLHLSDLATPTSKFDSCTLSRGLSASQIILVGLMLRPSSEIQGLETHRCSRLHAIYDCYDHWIYCAFCPSGVVGLSWS